MQNDRFFHEMQANCWGPEMRLRKYDLFGVQMKVLSTVPIRFSYWPHPLNCL